MEWISVKDRLPIEEGDYLVVCTDEEEGVKKNFIYVDTLKRYWVDQNISENERRSFLSEKPCFDPFCKATHWIPLPAPPKTENKEC